MLKAVEVITQSVALMIAPICRYSLTLAVEVDPISGASRAPKVFT
jgi:hypothetical protein